MALQIFFILLMGAHGMCQLLGLSSRLPMSLQFSLDSFMRRGGKTDDHADGWGIARYINNTLDLIVNTDAAANDPLAQQLIKHPFKTHNMIAHVRKATQGNIALTNCHPFTRCLWHEQWSFAHNGDLKAFNPHLLGFVAEGQTDSERAFCYLLNTLVAQFGAQVAPNTHRLTQAIAKIAKQIHQQGTFNFLLSNGSVLFAFCSTDLYYVERCAPFNAIRFIDSDLTVDFSDETNPTDKMVVISTKPLTHNEPWVQMQHGRLYAFSEGQCVTSICEMDESTFSEITAPNLTVHPQISPC